MYYALITTFSILMLVISILYFFMFSREQERFLQFWGLSWVAYALSLFSLLMYYTVGNELFLEFRKIVDMFNLLLLLFGSYSFMHRKIPAYWYRFSLYLLLLAAICIIYDFDLLSFYLPISVYQLILTLFICYNVLFRWRVGRAQKWISAVILFIWGAGKAVFSIMEIFADVTESFFLGEIIMSNVVNICILTICISYMRAENSLTDSIYRKVIEHTRGAVFYYQILPEPVFSYVSPSVEKLTGYRPEDFYMNPRLLQDMTAEPFAGDIVDIFDDRLKRNEYPTLELYRRDGRKFWCEFDYSFIRNENGENTALVGILRDVTDVKTAEVEQVNETRRRNILLSYISHELRTPITSIAGFLTAMEDGTLTSDEERQEAMEIITAKTMTLKQLIDDLDQLAKFESDQFTFSYEAYSVRDVVESLIVHNVPGAEKDGFRVDVEADLARLDRFWIILDLERINQVFSNLISNAVKYSGEDRTLRLRFLVDASEESLQVSVQDHGIGIPADQIPHVFDRFYRVGYNGSSYTAGRGLGLTLSREIIEAHQGEIFAESEPGSGSTFTFIIPLYKEK